MYCCEDKCFSLPRTHVDGIACRKCERFSYCMCRCTTFKKNLQNHKPTKEEFVLYKTTHFYTCCLDSCVKFHIGEMLLHGCRVCYPKTLCDCILITCKNRDSWQTL